MDEAPGLQCESEPVRRDKTLNTNNLPDKSASKQERRWAYAEKRFRGQRSSDRGGGQGVHAWTLRTPFLRLAKGQENLVRSLTKLISQTRT